MRCPSCGARVRREHDRCPSCGAALVAELRPQFGGAAREVRPELGMPDAPAQAEPARHVRRRWVPWAAGALAIAAVGVAAALALRGLGGTAGGVTIDSATFPDAALRAVVRTYDTDGNGSLSAEELAGVTSLDCSDRDVASLEGVGRLTSLRELDASGNHVTSADLSGCAGLTSVDLSDNGMQTLTLGSLPGLESLDVSGDALANIDLTGCAALRSLDCRDNALARLDLSRNASLESLEISEGQNVTIPIAAGFFPDEGLRQALSSLDTDGDGALSDRERTYVTSMTVSEPATASLQGLAWFPNLATLDVSGTQVTALRADEMGPQVTSVTAKGCPVTEVSLDGLAWLYTLDLSGTDVSSLDLTALVRLTTLDVSGCSALRSLDVAPCQTTLATLWCDEGLEVTGGVTKTSAAFPDEALRKAVFASQANANGDCLLTPAELSGLTSLDLTGTSVTSTKGLELLSSLSSLSARGLALGSFSCEGLSALMSLSLPACALTSVSLEGAPNLTSLDLSDNDLEALDLSATPALAWLSVTGNARLAQLDVSACPALADAANVQADETTALTSAEDGAEQPLEPEGTPA